MKQCRECGHKVSSEAKTCPNCGARKPYQSPVRGLIVLAFISVALYKGCNGINHTNAHDNGYAAQDITSNNAPTSQPFVSPDVVKVTRAVPVNLKAAPTAPYTVVQVCKATISGMFDRSVSTMRSRKTNIPGVFVISYRRPSDGQRFSLDCKLSDDNVIWRESGQFSDRWNGTGNVEFNVVFKILDKKLVITELHADSDDITYTFTKKDLH